MEKDYSTIIEESAQGVFQVMAPRTSEADMIRIKKAFELARKAHANQWRKGGEPYILHPIAVALILAEDLQLDANPVIAAFLHDVVEDTDYTLDQLREEFGDDVAFLVKVVTKKVVGKKNGEEYKFSKQLDNYRQLLDSMQHDIRAILVKLADRTHNMRTLASMKPEKQMKIAGETDYFYAPLANRLGLYNIKTELENLSFKYRCPDEYEEISKKIETHHDKNRANLDKFKAEIEQILQENEIRARVAIDYRRPYSLWRKMKKYGDDFNHLKYRHFIDIIFEDNQLGLSEKQMAMRIYCALTDKFREKHCSMSNYIDAPKENGYQSIHTKLLPDFGRWQEVHISSERMIRQSQLGCVVEKLESNNMSSNNIQRWIEKFRKVLQDTIKNQDPRYMEDIITTFYNDDIQVYTPTGDKVILPQNSTVIDFAYEVHTDLGDHAKYALINRHLEPVNTTLRRGDCVEIFTDPACHPEENWLEFAHTYKSKKCILKYLESIPKTKYLRCPECNAIPGEEVIGIQNYLNPEEITVHKRDCRKAISHASSYGEDVVKVEFTPDDTLYPVTLSVRAVDRSHLFIEILECITNEYHLFIESFNTTSERNIVLCNIRFDVHSNEELRNITSRLFAIPGVDEVKRLNDL